MGEPVENKDCFSKVCYVDSSGAVSRLVKSLELSLVVKNHPVLPASNAEACFVLAFSKLFSVQNKPFALSKFWVAYSEAHSGSISPS